MPNTNGPAPPRVAFWMVAGMLAMVVLPAAVTLHTANLSAYVDVVSKNPSPYGYTVSLALFVVPILVIGLWFIPRDGVKVSQKSFWITIGLLFPVGAILDFFFAHLFLTFPNHQATLRLSAPALGGGVPIEEYLFYFTGFVVVLLLYIWMDEYWLAAYSIPSTAKERTEFARLIQFHPESLFLAIALIGAAVVYKKFFAPGPPGFPGYFTFLTLTALLPSAAFLPVARPVINWRALSLTLFMILLTSLLWEATLAIPYGWWGYQMSSMVGLNVTAWDNLPIEAVFVWIAVTYTTVIVYEIVKRWKSSGKGARPAFFGVKAGSGPAT